MSRPINPWKDFASYESSDARYFKGREESIAKFLRIVDADTMSVLYASSGIGKTSFIQAGIVPVMMERGYAPIHILFTDDDFVEGDDLSMILKSHVEDEIKKHNENEDKTREEKKKQNEDYITNKWEWNSLLDARSEGIEQVIKSLDEKFLWWKFHACEIKTESGHSLKPLLLLDQFEEVFVKAKAKNVKLQTFFDELEELASNNLPSEVEKVLNQMANQGIFFDLDTHHHYKIIFSLRKEYLSDFDYWTNDRHSIAELQQNRMLLLPLSRTKAMKVIKEQPLDLEGSKCYTTLNNIAEEILNVIDDKQRNEIEPFILSVLCSRLYDRAVSLRKTELKLEDLNTYSAQTIIREFYEQKIQSIIPKQSHVKRIEEELIDEDGKRGRVKVKRLKDIEFEKQYKKDLVDAHLVRIDSYNGEDYIELVHDRVADAIMERRKESTKKNMLIFARIASFAFIIGLFFLTFYIQTLPTSVKNSKEIIPEPYLLYQEKGEENVVDTTTYNLCKVGDFNIKTLSCTGNLNVYNCPNLKSVNVKGCEISIKSCHELEEISFGQQWWIKLSIVDCPKLNPIQIPSYLRKIEFTCIPPNDLTFHTDKSRYFIWKDNVLWSLRDSTIVYARYDADTNITPPFEIKADTLKYQARDFIKTNNDYISLKVAPKKTILVSKYAEELDYKDSLAFSSYYGWNMSQFPNLRKVTLPENWNYFNVSFKGCTKLESVILPDSLRKINASTFEGCSSLSEIVFPDSVNCIESLAFRGCSSLKEIILPDNVSIGQDAFDKCTNLETVRLPRTLYLYHGIFDGSRFMFKGCPNVRFVIDDNRKWTKADDNTSVYHGVTLQNGDILPILFINEVKNHTYKSDPFSIDSTQYRYFSKDGALYLKINNTDKLLNDPNNKIIQGSEVFKVSPNSQVVSIPLKRRNITLEGSLDGCKEIHFPYPTIVGREDILGDIPKEMKHNITLYVPYGALPNFQNSDLFDADAWKSIVEESRFSTGCRIFLYHLETGIDVWREWGILGYVIAAVLLFAILMTYFNMKKNKVGITAKNNWMVSFGHFSLTIIVGVLTWFVIYWFLYLMLERVIPLESSIDNLIHNVFSNIVSICLAVMFIYIVLYSQGFNLKGFGKAVKRIVKGFFNSLGNGYLFIKRLSWQSVLNCVKMIFIAFMSFVIVTVQTCHRILLKCKKYLLRIVSNISSLSYKIKIGICMLVLGVPILSVKYCANKTYDEKMRDEILDYYSCISELDSINDRQIEELRDKLIRSISFPGMRSDFSDNSRFEALGDSLFIIRDNDSCYYINFANKHSGYINFGNSMHSSKGNFYLSESKLYIACQSNDSLYIWPKNHMEQNPVISVPCLHSYYESVAWHSNDNYVCVQTELYTCKEYNTNTGKLMRTFPVKGSMKGILNKDFLLCEDSEKLSLYSLKSGKLIDSKVNNKDYYINKFNTYAYHKPHLIDSLYLLGVDNKKIVFDTIPCPPFFYVYTFANFILFERNNTSYIYNVSQRKMTLFERTNLVANMNSSLVALCQNNKTMIYILCDSLKLLSRIDYSNYSHTAFCNLLAIGDSLYYYDSDSLKKINIPEYNYYDLTLKDNHWIIINKNYYSLDHIYAGSYPTFKSTPSSILRGGWCFVLYGNRYKLQNVKSTKLLIKESRCLSEEEKKKLIQLIDKQKPTNR